ncbi:zinc knuckle CX2CX4HX4C containing protein [Tanacetum coccineum]
MERGFLTASNFKINNNTNNLAARVRNIDDGVVKDSTKAGVEGNVLIVPSTGAVKDHGAAVNECNQQKKVIKIKELHNEEVVEGAAVAIPIDVVEEAKYGLQHVMLQKGFFFFQFSTKEGMEKVLENRPWLIRLVSLILNVWTPNTILKKDVISLAQIWVKLHNVPIVAYSETGLSLITTQIGRPIMIDAYTSEMCVNPWGRSTYARALIEVSAAKALMDSLVVAIPLPNGKGHTLETIDIEYEWKPPRCENCNVFYHSGLHCPKRVVIAKPVDTNKSSAQPSTSGEDGDGFVEVKNRKKKGKDEKVSRNIDGIKFSKPKVQFWQRKQGDSSKRAPNKGTADTPQVSGELKTPTSNTFDVLNVVNEEEQVVSNPNRNEEGNNDPQGKVDGSVQTGVKKSTEAHVETIGLSSKVTNERGSPVSKNDYASTSYPASTTWECINESDTDDDNYGSSLGGGNQLEDEDLDFSDGYEDQVFDLPGELKNFRDFKLNMSGRK